MVFPFARHVSERGHGHPPVQLELKTERFGIAYRLLFSYAFVGQESEQNSSPGHSTNESDRRVISRSAMVLYVPTPQVSRYWQAAACPRAAGKSAAYQSLRFHIGSFGAVGGHNNTGTRLALASGCQGRPGIESSGADPLPGQGHPIEAGEFILGYPGEAGVPLGHAAKNYS
jgi:hypothetical protein